MIAFHWLSCESLSLATQLPGKEKIFLPPASLPASTSLSAGICVDLSRVCMRLASGLHFSEVSLY